MKAISFILEIFRFSKLSLSSKITLYFAVFGLFIFYFTSVAWIVVSQKSLADSITRIVQAQISKIKVDSSGDMWWHFIDKEHQELKDLSLILANLTSGSHTILDTSIYGRTANDSTWQKLFLDDNGIVKAVSIDQAKTNDLSSHFEKRLFNSDSNLFLGSHKIALFVNITAPSDKGKYFYKVAIDKNGISCLMKYRVLNSFLFH